MTKVEKFHRRMHPLKLSPLPSLRSDEVPCAPQIESDCFVDDAVVLALMAGPVAHREFPQTAELALAADDMDFAGWCLSPFRTTTANPTELRVTRPTSAPQRPAPPVPEELGLGEPHRGQHRWWLAGLAGVISTLLFSLLLLSLSSRFSSGHGKNFPVETLAKPRALIPAEAAPSESPAPQLTDVSP